MHFKDILNLAARAWHETKPASDPEFNECQVTHRENLGAAAQAVVNFGSAFTAFDEAVLRIYRADQESQGEAEKILSANPTLHGDEVMHIASGAPHPLAGHAENVQMAAVREDFRGVDSSEFEANRQMPSASHGSTMTVALVDDATVTTANLMGDRAPAVESPSIKEIPTKRKRKKEN